MKQSIHIAALGAVMTFAVACQERDTAPAKSTEERHEEKGGAEEGHDDHEEGEGPGIITLTFEAAANAQLQYGQAERRALAASLSVPSRVVFSQQGHARISSRVPGRLADLRVVAGTHVKQGQVLAHVESQALAEARAKYLSAAARARVARGNLDREKELLEKGITSEREMREAQATSAAADAELNAAEATLHALGLEDAEIRALRLDEHYGSRVPVTTPIAGTVVEVLGSVGQSVEPTDPLFVVGNLSELWVMLDVPESQLPGIAQNMKVVITLPSRPGTRYGGVVTYIGDVVDPKTRTIPVRVVVPNPNRELKPGMFATAELRGDSDGGAGTESIVVPRAAVQKMGEKQIVFVPEGESGFRAVKVQTGRSTSGEVEILSGLEPGTRVVTRGAFILKSELSKGNLGDSHGH